MREHFKKSIHDLKEDATTTTSVVSPDAKGTGLGGEKSLQLPLGKLNLGVKGVQTLKSLKQKINNK